MAVGVRKMGDRRRSALDRPAEQAFDAVEAGETEMLADERSRFVKASLSRDHQLIYPPIQAFWDAAVKCTW